MSTLKVLYTCQACGIVKRPVTVRCRRETEDLMAWMGLVQRRVGDDHRSQSPTCHSSKCDLMIPAPEGSRWVGEKDAPSTPTPGPDFEEA